MPSHNTVPQVWRANQGRAMAVRKQVPLFCAAPLGDHRHTRRLSETTGTVCLFSALISTPINLSPLTNGINRL